MPRHANVGPIGPHAHSAAPAHLVHAPAFGPPPPPAGALCSKVPGTHLAAAPGNTLAASSSPAASAPVASTAPGVPVGTPVVSPAAGAPSAVPLGGAGAVGTSKAATIAALAMAGLVSAGLGVAALPSGGVGQPTTLDTIATPDTMPTNTTPNTLLVGTPDSGGAPAPFLATMPSDEQIPDTPKPKALLERPALIAHLPTAVPEPASLFALSVGTLVAALARARRR